MANLRDRGYGNSMEGYRLQLKKEPAPRRSRKKTVAPGEASVSKGQKVTNSPVRDSAVMRLPSPEENRASYGKAPVNAGPLQRSEPINLQYNDIYDKISHDDEVEIPYREYARERDTAPINTMSLEEIKRRMKELERALNSAYDSQRDRAKVRPYTDYNWDVAEAIDDNLLGLNADEPTQQIAFMDYQKAARAGETATNTPEVDKLYFEYNNLKNEYNARLAQYLQGLR